jgi:hypothetical protein
LATSWRASQQKSRLSTTSSPGRWFSGNHNFLQALRLLLFCRRDTILAP